MRDFFRRGKLLWNHDREYRRLNNVFMYLVRRYIAAAMKTPSDSELMLYYSAGMDRIRRDVEIGLYKRKFIQEGL